MRVTRKAPLLNACARLALNPPKSANLERLCSTLAKHWFPPAPVPPAPPHIRRALQPTTNLLPLLSNITESFVVDHRTARPASIAGSQGSSLILLLSAPPRTLLCSQPHANAESPEIDIEPQQEHNVQGEDDEAALLRHYNVKGANAYELLGYDKDGSNDEGEDEDEEGGHDKSDGGEDGPDKGENGPKNMETWWSKDPGHDDPSLECRQTIPDNKVNEHSLLLFIKFSVERAKCNHRGVDIPGTFLGANKTLQILLWLTDTWRHQLSSTIPSRPEWMKPSSESAIRLAIWAHLAWTAEHASGNRGNDFRTLKLAELQPTTLKHPDKRTDIWSVLGMQGEEKAGKCGMLTVINPVYCVFITNMKPEMCPLGAFAFYFHYIYDEKNIIETMKLDYTINKSWRQIQVLHGPKSPTTPFNEQKLYNLYCRSYKHVGFKSCLNAHLPCHLLGYRQEAVGVDPLETSKLGWCLTRNQAILRAAGYHTDKVYNPIWCKVCVPSQFLDLVCPMAEEMQEKVAGNLHLSGAFHHWEMVIELREYLFQCGATILQLVPKSSIFRLPAFQDPDIRNWVTMEYPAQLSMLQAAVGDPLEIERVQNVILARALTSLNRTLSDMRNDPPTFMPAWGFSAGVYTRNAILDHDVPMPSPGSMILPRDNTVHSTLPSLVSNSLLQYTSQSPRSSSMSAGASAPRLIAQVQLILPPLASFYLKGGPIGVIHPIIGIQSARWVEDVFPMIKQPDMCWDVWGPGSGLEQFPDVSARWDIYAAGARTLQPSGDGDGHEWRTSHIPQVKNNLKKVCERFSEIPEWVDCELTTHCVAPEIVIAELEELHAREEGGPRGLSWLSKELGRQRKDAKQSSSDQISESKPRKCAVAVDARRPGSRASKKQKCTQ
ncbi:hypothetical protein K438DRAFT_1758867 [Mycena galopus ATCC 62051]|nr:hypothetical protein K438DRAFT_1758867 [Mycena galopus ATCC 62051]